MSTINIDARLLMPIVEITARVEMKDGKPELVPERDQRSRWLTALAREKDRRLSVVVMRQKLRRSTKANAYLWGVVYKELLAGLRMLADQAGERCPFASEDELHEAMKYVHLGTDVLDVAGVKVERPSSSAVLDIDGFTGYVSAIKRMAAERWQIYISEPE